MIRRGSSPACPSQPDARAPWTWIMRVVGSWERIPARGHGCDAARAHAGDATRSRSRSSCWAQARERVAAASQSTVTRGNARSVAILDRHPPRRCPDAAPAGDNHTTPPNTKSDEQLTRCYGGVPPGQSGPRGGRLADVQQRERSREHLLTDRDHAPRPRSPTRTSPRSSGHAACRAWQESLLDKAGGLRVAGRTTPP